MKKITTDRKLSLNSETLQNLTGPELSGVVGGAKDSSESNTTVIELTRDKNEPNCTFTSQRP